MSSTSPFISSTPAQFSMTPRSLPFALRMRLFFGGARSQAGWLIFGVGMVLFWMVAMHSDISSLYRFHGRLAVAAGSVLSRQATSYMLPGATRYVRGTHTNRYAYSFTAADGRAYSGRSYDTWKTADRLKEGDQVEVEYKPENPSISRIVGTQSAPVSAWGAAVVLFPLLGLHLIFSGLRENRKAARLLRDGTLGYGRLVSSEPTKEVIFNKTVFLLTFRFVAGNGLTCQATSKTRTPELMKMDAEKPLMYDPADPSQAVMLDGLPGSPELDETGGLRSGGAAALWACLLIPAAAICGNGVYIWYNWIFPG